MEKSSTVKIGGTGMVLLAVAVAALLIAGVTFYQSTVALNSNSRGVSTPIAELDSMKKDIASLKEQLNVIAKDAKDAKTTAEALKRTEKDMPAPTAMPMTPTPQMPMMPMAPPTQRDIAINISSEGFNGDKNLIITVNRGDKIKLTVKNVDTVKGNNHGFEIQGLGIDILNAYSRGLAPGESATFEFVAEKPGVYAFMCNVPCLGHGFLQTGQLRVA